VSSLIFLLPNSVIELTSPRNILGVHSKSSKKIMCFANKFYIKINYI
jgi:hypothetical protein